MRKGNKVVVRAGADLFRNTTSDEQEAWRKIRSEIVRLARRDGADEAHVMSLIMDGAGEPKMAPLTRCRNETAGEWTVVRARVRTTRNYHVVSGLALIRHTDGTEWYTGRENVHVISAGTGPAPTVPAARVGTDADIEAWVRRVNRTYPRQFGAIRRVGFGRLYARVYLEQRSGSRSVYCFVDRSNGDVLKAASWKTPAKHVRGNIYAADPLAGVGVYGANYLT